VTSDKKNLAKPAGKGQLYTRDQDESSDSVDMVGICNAQATNQKQLIG